MPIHPSFRLVRPSHVVLLENSKSQSTENRKAGGTSLSNLDFLLETNTLFSAQSHGLTLSKKGKFMGLILLIVLLVLIVGSAPAWPYSRNWGYAPSGGLGTILLLVLILWLLGVI